MLILRVQQMSTLQELNAEEVGDVIGEAFTDKTKEPKAKLSEESKQTLSEDFIYEELKKASCWESCQLPYL